MAFDSASYPCRRADGSDAHATYSTHLQMFVFVLFFAFGGITSLNDVLIPKLKALFTLTYGEVMLVQLAFFAAYFIISIPAAALVRRIGYMRSAVVGLLTMTAGCLLFMPASSHGLFGLFLLALFVLASGITTVQVVANPADLHARAGAHRQQPPDLCAGVQLARHDHISVRGIDADSGLVGDNRSHDLVGRRARCLPRRRDPGHGPHLYRPRHRARWCVAAVVWLERKRLVEVPAGARRRSCAHSICSRGRALPSARCASFSTWAAKSRSAR